MMGDGLLVFIFLTRKIARRPRTSCLQLDIGFTVNSL